jgi:uncharacterized protein YfiM (DUF2279 family)
MRTSITNLYKSSLVIILAVLPLITSAQFSLYDTIPFRKEKLTTLTIGVSSAYLVSMAVLNRVWYKENSRESFRFFNDNSEWKQIDKVGHFYSSFYISALSARAINRCGIASRRSATTGAIIGFTSLLTVEIFDGFSNAYGASGGDLIANSAGSLFFLLQQRGWNEQRILPKFSFQPSSYAAKRPTLLGQNIGEQLIKDYNGQTYWLSVDMDKFIHFPSWLNLAIGYGAEAMVYADDRENSAAGFGAYRQYYFSIDVDLSSIRTRSRFVKGLLTAVSIIKLPAPAIEFSAKGAKFRPLFF